MTEQDVLLQDEKVYYLLKREYKMRIAICDDEAVFINELKPMINRYANSHRIDVVIDSYKSGEALIQSSVAYDMIFLDYQMEGIDGLKTAKILRSRNVLCSIVFITNYPHFVYEAFKVGTFRFCPKPIDRKVVDEIFDGYFQKYGHDYPLILTSDRETITIHTKDITFLEANLKHCIIHLADKRQIDCAKTMSEIQRLLPRTHFYKIHKSFFINFNYIEKYTKEKIFLKNGVSTPYISRNYWTAFKNAYKNYSASRHSDDLVR